VYVTEQRLDDYARVIRNAIDEPHVTVVTAADSILVSGNVDDVTEFNRIADLVSRFLALSKTEKFEVVNAVTVSQPLGQLQSQLQKTPGLERVRVDLDGKGNVVVSGTVEDRKTAQLALQRAGGIAGAYLSGDGKVIDRIATDKTTQIGVKVYVLEVDDTGMSQLGLRLQGATPNPSNPGTYTYGSASFIAQESPLASTAGRALNLGPFSRVTALAPTLDLVLTTGHAKILSEPDLITTPGVPATFLVGGEIPYVVSTTLGQVSIVFKEYGVKLDMTPTILGNGNIDAIIAPEVSDLDYTNAIEINGFQIPALKTSKLSTEVIVQPGESVVLGGILRRIDQRTIQSIPVLGNLPILGKLFRSTSYQHNDTDVVFVMTPEAIVR
jgi:pilus assembly protein CpaC